MPTLSSASGAVRGPAGNGAIVSVPGINGANLIANGDVNGTASAPRPRTSTPLPALAPSTSVASNEAAQPVYAGGVWTNCFIGGWGEGLYGDPSVGWGEQVAQMSSANGGRSAGCVSCGWGWGHDSSAFEVIRVEVIEVSLTLPFPPWFGAEVEQKQAHVSPGFGRRNQAQRLAEYA